MPIPHPQSAAAAIAATAIAASLHVRPEQVAAVISLLDADNTVPFISRYRKEATCGLDDEQVREVQVRLDKLRKLDERRAAILTSMDEQGALTPELRARLESAATLTELEDLYQPYRPKRKTRASAAKERGLQPLADLIIQQPRTGKTPAQAAAPFVNDDVPSLEDALAGARDIVAETIADHSDVRRITRDKARQWGSLESAKIGKAEDEKGVYETYYAFSLRLDRLRPHQVLALNRGETEKILRIKMIVIERDWRAAIAEYFPMRPDSPFAGELRLALEDAAERLLLPAIERDLRRTLTEQAERHAIAVFASNLRALLNQPPLAGHTVMGIDPGFRTGCKAAVVDATGKVIDTTTIYPHPPQNKSAEAAAELAALIQKHGVTLIAIGNGTASRETEKLAASLITQPPSPWPSPPVGLGERGLQYLITNEAGASVYSASPLARAELPGMDVSMRGAVSIARRVQDPLAELVKIDPQSIGVGMYQHDVDQGELSGTLDAVVESVVNRVGVDVNTASPALLGYVAGIGAKLAGRIVAHRDERGPFGDRESLRAVAGLGPKAFEQAAGFLRIRHGSNPLDESAIHPESYPVAQAILETARLGLDAPAGARAPALDRLRAEIPVPDLAARLGTGVLTLEDILDQLVRPGRDPRADLPAPILRSDVLSLEDLATGMTLKGTVRNVVDFGAFVDIGVKYDGLLHRNQIPAGESLSVGDVIDVVIKAIESERGRIGLGWGRPANA